MHGRACPRGLAASGAKRPVGPVVRGAVSGLGGFSWWLEFLEEVAVHLFLADNYNITTRIRPQSRRAHRDLRLRFRGCLRLDDLCGMWASLARQPIGGATSCHDPWLVLVGSPPVGRAASSSVGRRSCGLSHGRACPCGLAAWGAGEAGRAWCQGGLPPERVAFEGAGGPDSRKAR
jgi:hypothetical protein